LAASPILFSLHFSFFLILNNTTIFSQCSTKH
jgi:hypothetical protein